MDYLCSMFSDRTRTVSFTGHRTYCGEADAALAETLRQLYAEGYRVFISGMAVGFDLAAAEAVLALREAYPEVRLVCAVPFEGQERRVPAAEKVRYGRVRERADASVVVCGGYRPDCYARRNDYLADRASVLVAWYDGSAGGTRYTVRRALRTGREVRNLHPSACEAAHPGQGTLF